MKYYPLELTGVVTRLSMNPGASVVGVASSATPFTYQTPPSVIVSDPHGIDSISHRALIERHVVLVSQEAILNPMQHAAEFSSCVEGSVYYDFTTLNAESRFDMIGSFQFQHGGKKVSTWLVYLETLANEILAAMPMGRPTPPLSELTTVQTSSRSAARQPVRNTQIESESSSFAHLG